MFKSLFDPNSAFARAMDRVASLILLNVLWLVCSLPVITAGAATAALYELLEKLVLNHREDHLTGRFFQAFRSNFRRATAVWLVLLAAAAICAADLVLANGQRVWQVPAVLGLQVVALVMTLVFPLLGRYDNTVGNHLRNAALLSVGHLPRVLLIWLIWAVPIGAMLFVPGMVYYLSIVWLLIGYASLSYITVLILCPVLEKLDGSGE